MTDADPREVPAGAPEDAQDSRPQNLEGRVAELEEVVEDLERALVDLARRIRSSTGDAPAGVQDEDEAETEDAAPPRSWAARASAQDWHDLAAWVDWLGETYDLQPSKGVLPCWPAHGGAVHELAALWTAWTSAATVDASDEPGDAMASWHHNLLRPCLNRLHEDYQLRTCEDRHKDPRPLRVTDPDLLAVALDRAVPPAGDDGLDADDVDRSTGELR